MQRLLTVTELADLVGVPRQTVYTWASRGGGPIPIKVGRHLRYRPADVEAWLASRAKSA